MRSLTRAADRLGRRVGIAIRTGYDTTPESEVWDFNPFRTGCRRNTGQCHCIINTPRRFRKMTNPLLVPVLGWLRRLSWPRLFVLTATLFVISVLLPDPLPFVDELLLGLTALLLAGRKRRTPTPESPTAVARASPR